MEMLGGKEALAQCRTDQIMADAAYVILTRDSRARTGEFLIDEDVLKDVGVTDFEKYSCVPGEERPQSARERATISYAFKGPFEPCEQVLTLSLLLCSRPTKTAMLRRLHRKYSERYPRLQNSSTREQSNKRSGTRLKTVSETGERRPTGV